MAKIIIGSDHAGFKFKEILKAYLIEQGLQVKDIGAYSLERCDFPLIAGDLASQVSRGKFKRGILVCNSGIGNSIVANRFPGVYAALCHNIKAAKLSRQHNDSNVLVLGAAFVTVSVAKRLVRAWLNTAFLGGRYKQRINQITKIEKSIALKKKK